MAREILNDKIRDYCTAHGTDYRDTWNALYKQFLLTFHINLKVRARNRKLRPIAYAESCGFICLLLGLALILFFNY